MKDEIGCEEIGSQEAKHGVGEGLTKECSDVGPDIISEEEWI